MTYVAFVDPAGGSGADSMTLAIAHAVPGVSGIGTVAVLDAIAEWRPPFSPVSTTGEAAAVLARYRVSHVHGDRYAGEWPREAFRAHGVEYVVSEHSKSDIYRELLPLINSGRVELLDHKRLLTQLAGLERRTARGGRDSIDHGPRAHDDVANAAAGALVLAATHGAKHWTAEQVIAFGSAQDNLARPGTWAGADASMDWRGK